MCRHSFEVAIEALAPGVAASLAARCRADTAFCGRVRRFAVETLGWTFSSGAADYGRLARLAALALLADLGCAEALRRHDPVGAERGKGDEVRDDLLREIALGGLAAEEQRRLLGEAGRYDPAQSPIDELGPLWEALSSLTERRRVGRFYSAADPIDLILTYCLRSAGEALLDPACGSGAFLVRALARLRALAPEARAADLARLLYGVDRDGPALRLARCNVAARTGGVPHLRQADFFTLDRSALPPMGAVVGNPPYTRQELLGNRGDRQKVAARRAVAAEWGQGVSGRSGLHVPFLLHAAAFLAPGGRLGMLISNSWLTADYGAALRRFLLARCRIVAVIAPGGERWFGAAVNPVVIIAEREDDAGARLAQRARFVRLKRPLGELIEEVTAPERWRALEQLVARIGAVAESAEDGDLRVVAVRQEALGGGTKAFPSPPLRGRSLRGKAGTATPEVAKWGVYLRAPAGYFALLERAGDLFCPLDRLATVRRGLTTGCNDFFYVRDVTDQVEGALLAALGVPGDRLGEWRIVEAGDRSRHVVEARYLRPLVSSPRELAGLTVEPARLGYRVVLLPAERAALAGTRALEYVAWGESAIFAKGRSAIPAAVRTTCAGRRSWWSLDAGAPAPLLWPKTHYRRHLVPLNPAGLPVDCNLYNITPNPDVDTALLAAMLNSTLVALQKELYGRANLGEGALKTEVSDLLALPVPDPRRFAPEAALRLKQAWAALAGRRVGTLAEEQERADRRALDEALFVALGCGGAAECQVERARLYEGLAGLLDERLGCRATVASCH